MRRRSFGPIAQLVEPAAHNRLVPGSSPGGPTKSPLRSERFDCAVSDEDKEVRGVQKELINLFEIQKIDSEMFQLQERRKTLAERLETLESQVNGLGGGIVSLESEIEVFEKEAKTLESTVQAEKLKIRKWEARLKEIRNQREFLALSREIDGAKITKCIAIAEREERKQKNSDK